MNNKMIKSHHRLLDFTLFVFVAVLVNVVVVVVVVALVLSVVRFLLYFCFPSEFL